MKEQKITCDTCGLEIRRPYEFINIYEHGLIFPLDERRSWDFCRYKCALIWTIKRGSLDLSEFTTKDDNDETI